MERYCESTESYRDVDIEVCKQCGRTAVTDSVPKFNPERHPLGAVSEDGTCVSLPSMPSPPVRDEPFRNTKQLLWRAKLWTLTKLES